MKRITLFKLVILAVWIALIFGLERVYNRPLFEDSLIWIKEWQHNSTQSTKYFFKTMSEIGNYTVIAPILILVYLWMTLQRSYIYLAVLSFSAYLDNCFKILYREPRPFWFNPNLDNDCETGFGQTSGHTLISTSVYLTLWHILTDFNFFRKKIIGIIIRYFLLILFIGLIFAIGVSRLYLAAHSGNQVLLSWTVGIGVYFLFFHVIEMHKFSVQGFFDMFVNKRSNLIFAVLYSLLIIFLLLIYFLVGPANDSLKSYLLILCPRKDSYMLLYNQALFAGFILFLLIGGHYGLVFLTFWVMNNYPHRLKEVNHWYYGKFKLQVFRVLLTILFFFPIILAGVIPGDTHLGVIYVFKVFIPYAWSGFNLWGLVVYLSIKLKIANPAITLM